MLAGAISVHVNNNANATINNSTLIGVEGILGSAIVVDSGSTIIIQVTACHSSHTLHLTASSADCI